MVFQINKEKKKALLAKMKNEGKQAVQKTRKQNGQTAWEQYLKKTQKNAPPKKNPKKTKWNAFFPLSDWQRLQGVMILSAGRTQEKHTGSATARVYKLAQPFGSMYQKPQKCPNTLP